MLLIITGSNIGFFPYSVLLCDVMWCAILNN